VTRIKGLSTKELRYIEKWIVWNIIIGVVAGLRLTIFYSFAPDAERHGTDAIIDAFQDGRYKRL